ncbi:unnamed protein product [Trichogramma brassicae]|uniref:Uncharacterized protein n=1 Tax=Trichogramma brassicae TaxID=86971 RepID=A0A6H5IL58_9HYME|nr:unnamed protein product [Trichogramma brassicae]
MRSARLDYPPGLRATRLVNCSRSYYYEFNIYCIVVRRHIQAQRKITARKRSGGQKLIFAVCSTINERLREKRKNNESFEEIRAKTAQQQPRSRTHIRAAWASTAAAAAATSTYNAADESEIVGQLSSSSTALYVRAETHVEKSCGCTPRVKSRACGSSRASLPIPAMSIGCVYISAGSMIRSMLNSIHHEYKCAS